MARNQEYEWLVSIINILSFVIGIQNLDSNNQQVEQLESHLIKQDKQYERIIALLEKEVADGRTDNK